MTKAQMTTDPALPQLSTALDGAAMAELFAAELREHGRQVVLCEVERVKYRPRRNCTLAYRLTLRDAGDGRLFEQRVAARLCSGGESMRRATSAGRKRLAASPAGPALRLLPEIDMLTWWWPNDAKLCAARWLTDERLMDEHVLPGVVAALAGSEGRLAGHDLQTMQYVPEQRLTVRVDMRWRHLGKPAQQACVYGKSSLEPDAASAHAILAELQASPAWREGRLRTPAALLSQPALQVHWQGAVPGLALIELPEVVRNTLAPSLGAQLAALHGTPLTFAPELTAAALRERLAQVVALLRLVLPAHAGALERLAARLADGIAPHTGGDTSTLHGDLHPRNILVDGTQVALIDLDNAHRGPALLDLGGYIAEGRCRAMLDGAATGRDAAAWDALLDGYARAGGTRPADAALDWAVAWQLLVERAWRCVVNLKPGRLALVPRLVDEALRLTGVHERSAA